MNEKIGPSKLYKSVRVEVEDIIEKILEEGSIPSVEINVIHYFVEHL